MINIFDKMIFLRYKYFVLFFLCNFYFVFSAFPRQKNPYKLNGNLVTEYLVDSEYLYLDFWLKNKSDKTIENIKLTVYYSSFPDDDMEIEKVEWEKYEQTLEIKEILDPEKELKEKYLLRIIESNEVDVDLNNYNIDFIYINAIFYTDGTVWKK